MRDQIYDQILQGFLVSRDMERTVADMQRTAYNSLKLIFAKYVESRGAVLTEQHPGPGRFETSLVECSKDRWNELIMSVSVKYVQNEATLRESVVTLQPGTSRRATRKRIRHEINVIVRKWTSPDNAIISGSENSVVGGENAWITKASEVVFEFGTPLYMGVKSDMLLVDGDNLIPINIEKSNESK